MILKADYQLYFTDGDLARVGQFISGWTQLTVILRAKGVSTIELVSPWTPQLAEWGVPGSRIVILRDIGAGWEYLTSGPIEHDDDYDWTAEQGEAADPGQLVLYFADERSRIVSRRSYPDPSADFEDQNSVARYTRTGVNPETIARDLVRLNAGPDALAYRQIPHLDLGTVAGVTGTVDYSTRFASLGDDLRALSAASGQNFDWRVRETATELLFEVVLPTDRSGSVRFSRVLGNVRALSYRHQAPVTTAALVGGDGTGITRNFKEVTVASDYGRRETFVNSQASSATELTQAGQKELVDSGEQASLRVSAVDTDSQRFGREYNLNDLVGVDVRPDLALTDYVSSVTIKVDRDGESVSPTIGTGDPTTNARTLTILKEQGRRIGEVERV